MIKDLHKFIKSLREQNNISQQEVANKLDISRASYIAVEQGKRELSLFEAQKISNIFGVSLKDMETGNIPNYEKYKEMILSFLRLFNSNGDGKVPKTKLAKLLYLADFAWFYAKFESMSGMQYRRIKYGPVPDLYFRALDELEEEGKINRDNKKTDVILISENQQLKKEKLDKINKEELALLKKITKKWKNKKTREIVCFAHNQLPFKLCSPNELIPYELIIQEDPDYVY
jgi:transcriptional regulator with XRE-family HTH domain